MNKQIEEMANISTKEEIDARNRRGKEKDELRQALLHYATAEASGGIKSLIDCEGCAFYLYENLGYRKIPEDSVVLSREEYDELTLTKQSIFDMLEERDDKARKETAKEIIDMLIPNCEVCDENWHKGCLCLRAMIAEKIVKQFGVEVEK